VRFSSCFPFLGETAFIVPPRSIWPPRGGGVVSAIKTRWKSARFIPLPLVAALLGGQPLHEDQWTVDGASECLLPAGQPGPFRTSVRWSAAVDRLTGNARSGIRRPASNSAAMRDCGPSCRSPMTRRTRAGPNRCAARSAVGGFRIRRRTLARLGTQRAAGVRRRHAAGDRASAPPTPAPSTQRGLARYPIAPSPAQEVPEADAAPTSHWLLSLFTPGLDDAVDWKRGNYTVIARGGRIDSPAGFGERKKQLQMVTEGSVLVAGDTIRGAAPDVAPEGFAHPCFAPASPCRFRCLAEATVMSMRYRLTCLTPLLVGDGRKLSPIDYMVWKDQVNVLDQWRIFRLLAKGPRLDGYLSQLKRADKLDFASWGGFAQNFAGRRIPFESPAYSAYWNRASGESLHIPTFATGASGDRICRERPSRARCAPAWSAPIGRAAC
jgi:hypothetical protein